MSSLYELTGARLALQQTLEDNGYDELTIIDTLTGNDTEIEAKIQDYGFLIKNRNAFAESIDAEITKLTARRDAEIARVKAIESNLLKSMIACDFKKIECASFTISVKRNPPKVIIDDEKQIPEGYWKLPSPPPMTINKSMISTAINSGLEVAGCRLESSRRLEIK